MSKAYSKLKLSRLVAHHGSVTKLADDLGFSRGCPGRWLRGGNVNATTRGKLNAAYKLLPVSAPVVTVTPLKRAYDIAKQLATAAGPESPAMELANILAHKLLEER